MSKSNDRFVNPARLLIAVAAFATPAAADELTIVHTGTGSGTLNGAPFGPAAFTITSTADTNNRSSFGGGFFINHTTSSIDIVGVAVLEVTRPTRTFVNNSGRIVGYSRAGISGSDLFNGPVDSQFAAWDMTTEIGPINGQGSLLQWASDMTTTGGILIFSNGVSATTFSAFFDSGCYPDCDTSTGVGILDIFDFLCFQNRYDAGAPYACDCDTSTGPGVCDIFDFLCFQNAFDAGCP